MPRMPRWCAELWGVAGAGRGCRVGGRFGVARACTTLHWPPGPVAGAALVNG
jgi:hypothetical protein